jgi:hypothetical protein
LDGELDWDQVLVDAIPAMRRTLARIERLLPSDPLATELAADEDLALFISFSVRAFLQRMGQLADDVAT